MSADVVVLTVYSVVLSCLAHGLRALGRRSTSPYASRVLAGHLRATGEAPEPLREDDWPHSEVPRLYTGIALVAALAATALAAAALALQDGVGLSAVALVVAVVTLLRLSGGAANRRRPPPAIGPGGARAAQPSSYDR